jgi:hypothetical protein
MAAEPKVPVRQEKLGPTSTPHCKPGSLLKASAKKSIACSTILVGALGSRSVGRYLPESRSGAH